MKTPCQACGTKVAEITKRFQPTLGFVCPECHEFLLESEKTLKRAGIEGITLYADGQPNHEKP